MEINGATSSNDGEEPHENNPHPKIVAMYRLFYMESEQIHREWNKCCNNLMDTFTQYPFPPIAVSSTRYIWLLVSNATPASNASQTANRASKICVEPSPVALSIPPSGWGIPIFLFFDFFFVFMWCLFRDDVAAAAAVVALAGISNTLMMSVWVALADCVVSQPSKRIHHIVFHPAWWFSMPKNIIEAKAASKVFAWKASSTLELMFSNCCFQMEM